jgi:hypothetical protein
MSSKTSDHGRLTSGQKKGVVTQNFSAILAPPQYWLRNVDATVIGE